MQSPIVLLDRDVLEGIDARCVAFDHSSGMRIATEHLLRLGHRDVALIIGGPNRPARERRLAVEETLAARGRRRDAARSTTASSRSTAGGARRSRS